MRVLTIGNYEPPHSTENELRDALERIPGVKVEPIQEQDVAQWEWLLSEIRHSTGIDMILWTSTRSLNAKVPEPVQRGMLMTAFEHEIPTVGYHLDRWWGLHANKRQEQMFDADGELLPFFGVQYLFTADGGHQQQWADVGVNHIWMPPAVSERWCYLAQADKRQAHDIVFVGGWEGYGHTEWTHRVEMVDKVRGWFGDRFRTLPKSGQPRITMGDLNVVYASAKVVIGDSCLVPLPDGSPMTHYCSDRIPETLGRGGILLHPSVEGIDDVYANQFVWPLGDWDALHEIIDALLDGYDSDEYWVAGSARDQRLMNIDYTKAHNTYTHRMREVIDIVTGERL
jgi:hypothetical protein